MPPYLIQKRLKAYVVDSPQWIKRQFMHVRWGRTLREYRDLGAELMLLNTMSLPNEWRFSGQCCSGVIKYACRVDGGEPYDCTMAPLFSSLFFLSFLGGIYHISTRV